MEQIRRNVFKHFADRSVAALLVTVLTMVVPAFAYAQTATTPSLPQSKRFFLSGHSLTDDPLAEHITAIVRSRGGEMTWNQQIVIGSPIRVRTKGDSKLPGDWNGYGLGKNKNGTSGLFILKELKKGTGLTYDTLIIAEGHKSVAGLIWNDTVRYLRHFHERMIEHNPATRTFLFEPWESIRDKANPAPWIALERNGSKVWGCVAERVNVSLRHEGRPDRIATIPAGAGLAALVESMAAGAVPELTAPPGKRQIDGLIQDDVHLSLKGVYFLALLSAATLSDRTVEGAWKPRGIDDAAALALQRFAWRFHVQRRDAALTSDLASCRAFMANQFCDAWNTYVPDQWASAQSNCKAYFARATSALDGEHAQNPFAFEAASDQAYWLPPP
jgi:hypothetical protein